MPTKMLLVVAVALPGGSVGGPMTVALFAILASIGLGLYEAWSRGRGVLGWIVSVVASLVGGITGMSSAEFIVAPLHLGQPAQLYVGLAIATVMLLLGSWIALKIVNRRR